MNKWIYWLAILGNCVLLLGLTGLVVDEVLEPGMAEAAFVIPVLSLLVIWLSRDGWSEVEKLKRDVKMAELRQRLSELGD